MSEPRQAASGCNREAANIKLLQSYFTESAKRVKLEFIRFAAWWRMAWG
jgi:hypothetical protein